MDAVERVIASLEAQVVGAEATRGAVGSTSTEPKRHKAPLDSDYTSGVTHNPFNS